MFNWRLEWEGFGIVDRQRVESFRWMLTAIVIIIIILLCLYISLCFNLSVVITSVWLTIKKHEHIECTVLLFCAVGMKFINVRIAMTLLWYFAALNLLIFVVSYKVAHS